MSQQIYLKVLQVATGISEIMTSTQQLLYKCSSHFTVFVKYLDDKILAFM